MLICPWADTGSGQHEMQHARWHVASMTDAGVLHDSKECTAFGDMERRSQETK